MGITNYQITTTIGRVNLQVIYPFLFNLSNIERKEFDNIGYTGKKLNGEESSREDYLNSLNKGLFQVTQTKYDNGNFQEAFTIVKVTE